ncbi:MAG: hypothetical protein BJ554DRAFT_5912, partial [Olpidium bornovanus]
MASSGASARNQETGENFAIKKVMRVFDKPILAKRALREIKLLRHFRSHENGTNSKSKIHSHARFPPDYLDLGHGARHDEAVQRD